ncbi:MAG: hypothetical protein ABI120_22920, partial [Gemmatimonadaceae bacterium]
MMREIVLEGSHASAFTSWRSAARALLRQHVAPELLYWRVQCDAQTNLLADGGMSDNTLDCIAPRGNSGQTRNADATPPDGALTAREPREFIRLAESVACHASSLRWD